MYCIVLIFPHAMHSVSPYSGEITVKYQAYKETAQFAAQEAVKQWRTKDITCDAAIERAAEYWNLQKHHVRELFFKELHHGN